MLKKKMLRLVTALLVVGLALTVYLTVRGGRASGSEPDRRLTNVELTNSLVEEMEAMDSVTVAALPALPVEPLVLPEPGVDVMRVRMEETYEVKGVGKDTVPLTGWIAVKHTNTRPAAGETTLTWDTAVTDTEFVAMDLRGESPIFGPVRITLDQTQSCVGQVGKLDLPFIVQVGLDATYSPYRRSQKATPAGAQNMKPTPQATAALPAELMRGPKAAVFQTLQNVMKAISAKQPEQMQRYYSKGADTVFFGNFAAGEKQRGGQNEVASLSKMFANIDTIQVVPDRDPRISISGKLAVVALTGTNVVTNREKLRGESRWRWTVELEQQGNQWLITHDHLSFFDNPESPLKDAGEIRGLTARGACCLASLSVDVSMPKLDLQMSTSTPVHWYSEVETIPPVGYTASVSVTPTPLVSHGREVATLTSGAVKFREVVRHVPFHDEAGR
jgi:ketosteroid isomerase-like protein